MQKIILLLLFVFTGCSVAKESITLSKAKNAKQDRMPEILFLDFEFTDNKGKDRVKLHSTIAAYGRIKHIENHLHESVKIFSILHYSDSRSPLVSKYKHPLNYIAEVPSHDGILSKHVVTQHRGNLTIRIPVDSALTHLELFRENLDVKPEKIFKINFKP